MTGWRLYVLVALAAAFGALGGVYRVVDPDEWPWWLDGLASSSWYVLAGLGGAVGVLLLRVRGHPPDSQESPADHHDLAVEPEDAADELEQDTSEQVDQEKAPTADELAEDLNDLTDEL